MELDGDPATFNGSACQLGVDVYGRLCSRDDERGAKIDRHRDVIAVEANQGDTILSHSGDRAKADTFSLFLLADDSNPSIGSAAVHKLGLGAWLEEEDELDVHLSFELDLELSEAILVERQPAVGMMQENASLHARRHKGLVGDVGL